MYKEGSGYDSKGKEGWKGWIGGLGKMRSVSVGPQVISYLLPVTQLSFILLLFIATKEMKNYMKYGLNT